MFAEMRERYGAAEIRDIRRQAEDWQRQASRDFSEGRIAEGLTAYDRRGFVRWEDRAEDAKAALVADWAQAQRERPEAVRFIYASTNREVDDLNRRCRALRVERGEVEARERFQTVRGELSAAAAHEKKPVLGLAPGALVEAAERGAEKGAKEAAGAFRDGVRALENAQERINAHLGLSWKLRVAALALMLCIGLGGGLVAGFWLTNHASSSEVIATAPGCANAGGRFSPAGPPAYPKSACVFWGE